jgi:hypothetical protein
LFLFLFLAYFSSFLCLLDYIFYFYFLLFLFCSIENTITPRVLGIKKRLQNFFVIYFLFVFCLGMHIGLFFGSIENTVGFSDFSVVERAGLV